MSQAFWYINGEPTNGKWVDMDCIDSTDEVLQELADAGIIPTDDDEEDQNTGTPVYDGDLLVADAEGLAKAFLGRNDTFDLDDFVESRDYCASNHVDEDAVVAYLSYAGSWSKSDFEDLYQGEADSEVAFAEQLCDDLGYLNEMPEHLRSYFDYEAFARDLFISDYWLEDGYVFRRC